MLNLNKAAVLVLVAGVASAAAAASAPAMMEDTVAVVNGEPILLSEFQKEEATSLAYWNRTNPAALADPASLRKVRDSVLEELITRELLVQEGKRLGIKVREREVDNAVEEIKGRFKKDDGTGAERDEAQTEKAFNDQLKAEGIDYAQFLERLKRQIMARKVIDEQVKAKLLPPGAQETREYFDKVNAYIASKSTGAPAGMDEDAAAALREAAQQIKALSSERVRVQRILIRLSPGATENERKRALKTAQELKRRLDQGEDFGKLAHDESEDPESAARGGDIGYMLRGIAPPELDKAAFSMDVGQTSEPILTDSGYNILRVTEKRAAEAPDYEHFKDDLAGFLGNVALQKKLEAYVKTLRDKAVIERHLPSPTA